MERTPGQKGLPTSGEQQCQRLYQNGDQQIVMGKQRQEVDDPKGEDGPRRGPGFRYQPIPDEQAGC